MRPNKTADAWMMMAFYGIGGTMISTYGAPALVETIGEGSISLTPSSIKTVLFGANAFSKAYWMNVAKNVIIEGTDQMISNHGDYTQLDVWDLTAQGFLGLNTPISSALTSTINYKPFSPVSDDIFNFNFNYGAAVDFATSYSAGKSVRSQEFKNP